MNSVSKNSLTKNELTKNRLWVNNRAIAIVCFLAILLLSNITFAAGIPVNIIKAEQKDIESIKLVNSKIEPYKDVNVSSKTGGIIKKTNVVLGEYIEEGQSLIEFEQDDIKIQIQLAEAALQIARANHDKLLKGATAEQIRIAEAGVRQADSALKIAKANYKMMKDGASQEDRQSVKAQYQQAVSSYEGARNNLELIESSYSDRTMQKQQLLGADTQLKSAKKQVEVAEERFQQSQTGLQQAKNGLEQARNEYERIEYLYQENVATKQQYEMVGNQYQNAQSAVENAQSTVESARIAKEQAELSYQGAQENYSLSEDSYNNPTQLKQQLSAARTQLEVAQANKTMAKANLDKVEKGARAEELLTAQANIEQAESALVRAEAQLDQVNNGATEEDKIISGANIKQAEVALQRARKALSDSIIKSPISGIVAQLNFDAGEMAGPGTPLVNLVNLDKVYIKAEVTADLLLNINKGDNAKAKILAYQDKYLSGIIEYVSPMANQRSQAFTVKVLAENPDRLVKGGMFADLYFKTNIIKNAFILPAEAVMNLENNPYVYMVINGKAVRKSVKVGISTDEEVAVVEGLSAEDVVILRGQSGISDGATVEVVE